ncbi:hypothetical protein AAH979_41425 [Plantactinospora sp. ZYX-F-223]|uniref:hypothetical protein n=1 Tax=Plantactinospora sp. ZYX-F-223 TaxID=3144103 RepID=UPI0031FD28E3
MSESTNDVEARTDRAGFSESPVAWGDDSSTRSERSGLDGATAPGLDKPTARSGDCGTGGRDGADDRHGSRHPLEGRSGPGNRDATASDQSSRAERAWLGVAAVTSRGVGSVSAGLSAATNEVRAAAAAVGEGIAASGRGAQEGVHAAQAAVTGMTPTLESKVAALEDVAKAGVTTVGDMARETRTTVGGGGDGMRQGHNGDPTKEPADKADDQHKTDQHNAELTASDLALHIAKTAGSLTVQNMAAMTGAEMVWTEMNVARDMLSDDPARQTHGERVINAIPGALYEATYPVLPEFVGAIAREMRDGASIGDAAFVAVEKAIAVAPFHEAVTHFERAESAHRRGDIPGSWEELVRGVNSYLLEVVKIAGTIELGVLGAELMSARLTALLGAVAEAGVARAGAATGEGAAARAATGEGALTENVAAHGEGTVAETAEQATDRLTREQAADNASDEALRIDDDRFSTPELLLKYQHEINEASHEYARLTNIESRKNIASAAGGDQGTSGWAGEKEAAAERARIEGNRAGHETSEHAFDPAGEEGKYECSHSERHAAAGTNRQIFGSSKSVCESCRDWFSHRAESQEAPQFIGDPDGVRVFEPDGSRHLMPHPNKAAAVDEAAGRTRIDTTVLSETGESPRVRVDPTVSEHGQAPAVVRGRLARQ